MVIVFILGVATGLSLYKIMMIKEKPRQYYQLRRLYPPNGHLVNPLVGVDNPVGGDVKLDAIQYSLEEYIRKCKEQGDVLSVSVYMRDLNKGTWVGVNEDERYASASLIKVPLLIAYLKQAENDPAILNKQIKYEKAAMNLPPQNIAPENCAQLGNTYSVDTLLRYMILYSDNISTLLLMDNIDQKLIADLYADLQLADPGLPEVEHQISAKEFSAFFRVLYNATYLNMELSEKAIKLFSESDFRDGIVAGVPQGVSVAHKFAERRYASEVSLTETVQLHDCGIVYYPQRPYVICVMTKGRDFNTLKRVISDISRIVYEHEGKALELF